MSKLLNRPLKAFTLYALIVLALSIPVYHYIVDAIWHEELDEHNEIIRLKTEDGLNKLHLTEAELLNSIQLLNRLEPGIDIRPTNSLQPPPDSLYTVTRENEYGNKKRVDRFRVLVSYIKINDKPFVLTVETNVEEVDETLLAIAIITVFFFLLLVGGFIFLNRRISKQIWKPFRNTLDIITSFDLNSQRNIEFEQSGIREFEELNNTLKKLIEKNISVFNQQKEFSENASHELQTPLAVLKSRIDLLLQNNTLSREQSEMIEALNIPLSRVSRINKNLLLLSKIENHHFADTEMVDVSEVVNDNLDFLSDAIEDKNITVEKNILTNVLVNVNKSLLEILITNLLVNAFRHNEQDGKLVIRLEKGAMRISNSGKAALNTDSLFQRFISSDRVTRSSGLGLAIVKQICNHYNWKISYSFHNDFHIFSVHF